MFIAPTRNAEIFVIIRTKWARSRVECVYQGLPRDNKVFLGRAILAMERVSLR